MNAYTFDIFIMHSIVLQVTTENNGIYTTTCELVEIGPLNGPDINNLGSIKTMIRAGCYFPRGSTGITRRKYGGVHRKLKQKSTHIY